MELVKIDEISKAFGSHQALKEISLSIPRGSIYGLLGPNGAGKTTLIRIITRIIEQDHGKVYLGGMEITPELVRKIGYLPEERGLYKKMRVGEQLIYLARLKGMTRPDAVQEIKSWLKALDLTSWHHKNIEDLSKGMAQKVQFIATVVHRPELIILDEPFSGFDPVNANLIKDEILKLKDNGTTVIFSTHRMESVEELCDHIALINRSEKILDGQKIAIKNQHKDGTYIIQHLGSLPKVDLFEVHGSRTMEDGSIETVVKADLNVKPNDLLKTILEHVQVHGFMEKIPSINEIFISKVNQSQSQVVNS